MAKLTDIFADKDMKAEDKVVAIAEVVATARKNYGNTELTITAPKVPTTEGNVDIKLLKAEDKVAIAEQQVRNIIAKVVAGTECTEGVIFDRQVEFYLAINPVLTNITAATDSDYI